MFERTFHNRAFVFFCALGWICTVSAVGADEVLDAQGPVAPQDAQEIAEPVLNTETPVAEPVAAPAQAEAAEPVAAPTEAPATEQEFVAEVGGEELPDGQTVRQGTLGLIDLHVKELDVTMVLQLLSLEAKRNIIATKNVAGTVSADLYNVDFYDALDAVLHANGYGYEERNNFIYVYTAEELETRRTTAQKPVVRIHRLNYLTAADASTFVSPLLSASGTISVSGAPTPGFQATMGAGGENSNAFGETLVIRDFVENVEEIVAVIREMDSRPKQVQVAATILEARLSELNAFGVDISAVIDFDFADFGTPLGAVDKILDGNGPALNETGQAAQTTVGNTGSGPSGIKIGILSSNVQAFIRALDSVTDTTVIAKPTLLALNRQRAELLVGERFGYLSTTATDTAATQTVEFLEVGTKLNFRAFISDDDFVRLELNPSVSDGSTTVVEGLVIPNETTNSLITNVMVRSGQTVVLGGLFKEDTQVDRNQVPGLGDVPILGYGFRGQDDTVSRSEVIFLITPTVVKDESLYAAGERAGESAELARVGAKKALLPWSRSRQTANYMRKATEYNREGRTDKALWNVNMALTLDPTFVEALRLKMELTGERLYMHNRSLLQDAVDHMVDDHTQTPAVPSDTAAPDADASAPTIDSEAPADQSETSAQQAPSQDEAPSVIEVLNADDNVTDAENTAVDTPY